MLSFYGFLRISNLVAATRQAFDKDRQLCRRDVTITPEGLLVYLKWAKNLQRADQSHIICLPKMRNPLLCLVVTMSTLFSLQAYDLDDLVIKVGHEPLTQSHLQRRLNSVIKSLGLSQDKLTYHALWHSGASLAQNNNVNFECIKSQGAWSSDSIWQYLFSLSEKIKEVPCMFQSLELSL